MRIATRLSAAAVLVAAALLSAPAAHASSIYPPAGSCTADPTTTAPGGSVTFSCVAETFSGDEPVTITVTGENGANAQIGFMQTAITTASGNATSEADGSLAGVDITFPADARGTYNIAAVSPTSAGGTAAVTVTSDDGGLPATGLDSGSVIGLWIGGAVLLVGGIGLAVAGVVRRKRHGA